MELIRKIQICIYVHYAQIDSNALKWNRQENQFADKGSTRVKYINWSEKEFTKRLYFFPGHYKLSFTVYTVVVILDWVGWFSNAAYLSVFYFVLSLNFEIGVVTRDLEYRPIK